MTTPNDDTCIQCGHREVWHGNPEAACVCCADRYRGPEMLVTAFIAVVGMLAIGLYVYLILRVG